MSTQNLSQNGKTKQFEQSFIPQEDLDSILSIVLLINSQVLESKQLINELGAELKAAETCLNSALREANHERR